MKVAIKSSERVAIIGRTGSGKTYLAEALTRSLTRFIVIDPNGLLANRFQPHIDFDDGFKFLEQGREARLYVSRDRPQDYEQVLDAIYKRLKNVVVYIDEAYGVVPPGTRAPDALWALYTRGRSRGLGVWASTQRPRFIPRFMLSEAEWFFVFALNLTDDREYLARIVHPAVIRPVRDVHGFYYFHINWPKPRYSRQLIVR